MHDDDIRQCTAFEGARRLASGALRDVVKAAKQAVDRGGEEPVLIFDDLTSEPVEVDFRGSIEDVLAKLERPAGGAAPTERVESAPRGPGRPKLGVVAREVTLLPRHWEWLNTQPGGASVTLRKLVEDARRASRGKDAVRHAQDATFRFMSAMAGNLPGFEEAARALYARDPERFERHMDPWPRDIRDHVRKISGAVWG